MSILEKPIDYESLEGELHDAIKADTLYQLQNDAKIRAIEQRVPTYDHFKDMVSAAHLKPMERSDMQFKLGVQWNSPASYMSSRVQLSNCFHTLRKPMSSESQNLNNNYEKSDNILVVPKTTEEFLQTWKKITCYKERYDYLLTMRSAVFMDIFRPEIPLGVLGEIMDACLRNLTENANADSVIDVLTALSHCNRFQLSINFMTKKENDISEQLFQRLVARSKAGDDADEFTVNALRKRYQITFD